MAPFVPCVGALCGCPVCGALCAGLIGLVPRSSFWARPYLLGWGVIRR